MTKDTRDYVASPLTVDEYDRRAQAHAFEMEKVRETKQVDLARAKNDVRRARWNAIKEIGIALVVGLVVVAVILGITLAVYKGNQGPDGKTDTQIEQEREQACVKNGGGYVPKDLLTTGTENGLCVYPGRTAGE